MRKKSYDCDRLPSYSTVTSTLALVFALAALCVGGAMATGVIVTSKQIKNGSILTQDIHKSAVKSTDIGTSAIHSTDIKNGAVDSADIGNGEVTPIDVTMPNPEQIKEAGGSVANPSMAFAKADDVGGFIKEDPSAVVEIDWTGSVEGHNGGEVSGCVFQLRIDGLPAPSGGGEVFGKGITSVAATALFPTIPTGPHQVEIWARLAAQEAGMGGAFDSCTVGPPAAGIGQTIVITEQIL
jgi:hypothetical protein